MFSRLPFAALVAYASATLEVTLCSDTQCKEEPFAKIRLNETNVCRTDFAGRALGVKVDPVDEKDRPQQRVRFYRSVDCFGHCGSGHLISEFLDGFQSMGGFTPKPVMQSFELVDVDEMGDYPPHGYCGIRHGDAQFFRGRTWKWQRIGDAAFREIPIEDWDPEIHTQQVSGHYDFHGAVDSDGKYKMHQITKNSWLGVPLEEWRDGVHVKNDEETVRADFPYEYYNEGIDEKEHEDL